MRAHIDTNDFGIFDGVPPLQLIEEHSKTRYFAVRFGLGLPPRPTPPAARRADRRRDPIRAAAHGSVCASRTAACGRIIRSGAPTQAALRTVTESFYCAEALRNFSRDTLPEGAFEHLQKQIFDGVIDVCEASHPCGFTRVNATTAHASALAVTSSALLGRFDISDRHGICHQLANEDRLTWVPSDD